MSGRKPPKQSIGNVRILDLVSSAHQKGPWTYNGNLPAEVVLDLACFDGIWGVLLDDLSKLCKT